MSTSFIGKNPSPVVFHSFRSEIILRVGGVPQNAQKLSNVVTKDKFVGKETRT